MRMRFPDERGRCERGGSRSSRGAARSATVNLVPEPTTLSTETSPPSFAISSFESARPSPDPSGFVVKSGSKIALWSSGGIPTPVSFTSTRTIESPFADVVIVTGGLGGTPDDLTREAVAAAFDVPTEEQEPLASELRHRFAGRGLGEYAARWARLPRGAEPLANPLGGAPGFVVGNVYVLPGLPSEMEAMFDGIAGRFAGGAPIASWRARYRTTEGEIVAVLEEATGRFAAVSVGSYPRFLEDGPEVTVVLKSADEEALAAATAWVEEALASRESR